MENIPELPPEIKNSLEGKTPNEKSVLLQKYFEEKLASYGNNEPLTDQMLTSKAFHLL